MKYLENGYSYKLRFCGVLKSIFCPVECPKTMFHLVFGLFDRGRFYKNCTFILDISKKSNAMVYLPITYSISNQTIYRGYCGDGRFERVAV